MIARRTRRRLPRRSADHRERRWRSRIRASARSSAQERPTARRRSSRTSAPNFRPAQAVGVLRRGAQAQEIEPQARASAAASISCRIGACANGATCTGSCTRSSRRWAGIPNEKPATYEQMHRALLAGLLGNIGTQVRRSRACISARAASGSPFFRGRRCARKAPQWVMAAELTETTRLYARYVAASIRTGSSALACISPRRHYSRSALGEGARRSRWPSSA